ncbi:MAG TPA: hypothetical protein VJR29_13775, partial [bacterium]|nr:hypothetical protein [bacterium]
NAGKRILVHAGTYEVSTTLTVPDGATVRGEGVMEYDGNGYPEGLAPDTAPVLQATLGLVGDIVVMGDGSRVENLLIRDLDMGPGGLCTADDATMCTPPNVPDPARQRCCSRNRGNLVKVAPRSQNDSVAAEIHQCELDNPNFSGIVPNGPSGRGVAVITRNLNLGNPPGADTDSVLSAKISHSVYRAGRGGSGVFAINFAARSHIDVLLHQNKFEGGVDANGGVSRPDAVHDSSTSITSIHNLYRPASAGTIIGMALTGGSGAPIPFPLDITTERNSLAMFSFRDRFEECGIGVLASGAVRFFSDADHVGPSSHNHLDLKLISAEFENSAFSDLYLVAARSADAFPTGDFNTLRALIVGAEGSNSPNNLYSDTAYGEFDLPLPPENAGQGNELEILGSLKSFLRVNDGFDQSPPSSEVFK